MICPNCFNNLNSNEKFCSKCGNNMQNSNISKHKVPIKDKLKTLFKKYKKLFISVLGIFLVATIGYILYVSLFGFDKLSWDKSYEHFKLEYVSQTNLKLGVKFNIEKKDEIKYSATCGKIKDNGLEIEWDLTESLGECKITASYKLRKITKKITVINPEASSNELAFEYEIDLDSDEDLDFDDLTNKQEKEYGTNPQLADTDMDGLYDNDELLTYKTDPTKKDTDSDGLSDYDEIELGLDPLKEDSKGDGLSDGKRTLNYSYESNNLKISITGTGNIASTIAQIEEDTKISGKKGFIDKLYTFYTDGNIDEAVVVVSYTDAEVEDAGLNEDNLSLYYYNVEEQKYEKVDTVVDKENNTLTAILKHFSSYVVGDNKLVVEDEINQILFVLDNSWSMYSNEQYKEITGKDYSGGLFDTDVLDAFDQEGIRFTLTSNLIDKLSSDKYEIGLSEFRRDYANALPIGSKKKELKDKLNNMNGVFITNTEGTNITNALENSITEFNEGNGGKYIVLLTDGQDSSLKYSTDMIVDKATENDVKICSIGFGDATYNVELANISVGTGCKFFSSSDVTGLDELFENINTELNDNLVDIDGDDKADGLLIADSGFIVNRDGFSFANYGSNYTSGHCFGMATFAQLYYTKMLPLEMGVINPDWDRITEDSDFGISILMYLTGATNDPSSNVYDFNDTYFENYTSLYDYKLKSNALKHVFGFEYFGEETPMVQMELKGKVLSYTNNYREEIEKLGIYDFTTYESGLSKEEQLEKWGVNYKVAEDIVLNETSMQDSHAIENEDLQLLNAIYAAFIKQNMQSLYSSSTNLSVILRNYIGTEDSYVVGGNIFIDILKERLNAKDPLVLSSDYGRGLHAINAISLARDIENPNHYYVGVYDNNYPGEKRYLDVECNFLSCITVPNDYYDGLGEPIRFTPSLEYDLQYYEQN